MKGNCRFEINGPQLCYFYMCSVRILAPLKFLCSFDYTSSNDKEVVDKLSDLHSVGTFVQIHELQDMGDKLRMIVMAHRRINITGLLVDNTEQEEKDALAQEGKGEIDFIP